MLVVCSIFTYVSLPSAEPYYYGEASYCINKVGLQIQRPAGRGLGAVLPVGVEWNGMHRYSLWNYGV